MYYLNSFRASLKGSVKKHEEICPKGPKDQSRKTKDPPEMRFVDIEQVYQQDLAHFDQELLSDDEAFDVLEDDSGGEEKNDVEMLETDLEVEAEPPSTTSAQKAMHSEAFTPENFESTTSTVKPEVKLESAGDHPCDEEDVLPNDPDEDGDFDHASEKLAQPSADYIDDLACGRCGYVAVSRYLLERHSKMKHPVVKNKKKYVYEKKFKCDECDMKCESKKRLEHHIEVRHRKVRSFICDLCGIETKSEKSLTTHRLQKHEHKPFFCQEPGCTFRSNCKYSLKEHNRAIHEEAKDNVCHVCGKGYSRASSLKSHYRFVHMKDYRHQCPQCNYGACTPAQLQNHVTSVHLKIRNICCELCDFKCSSKGSLLAHMRFTHGQGEKVKCSHCEKLFWSNSCLRKHINNVHLKILKHHCPDCDFKTASSSALKKHIERQVCKLQRKKGKKSKAEKERLLLFAGN